MKVFKSVFKIQSSKLLNEIFNIKNLAAYPDLVAPASEPNLEIAKVIQESFLKARIPADAESNKAAYLWLLCFSNKQQVHVVDFLDGFYDFLRARGGKVNGGAPLIAN